MQAKTTSTAERRPIATRDHPLSKAAAHYLTVLGATPNSISVAGMMCGLLAGTTIAMTSSFPEHQRLLWLLGAGGVQLRLLANMLDGMVAATTHQSSRLGELYNEIPDRISDVAILIGLGYAVGGDVAIGFWAALGAVFTAYVRAMSRIVSGVQDFCGPFAKPQRMFFATITALYLAVTPASWQVCWGDHQQSGLAAASLLLIAAGTWLTGIRRLGRAARRAKESPK